MHCFNSLELFNKEQNFKDGFLQAVIASALIHSYNKSQRDALFLKFIFDIELYMFRTDLPSIIRSLNIVYTDTQQQVLVVLVMLPVC